MKYLLISIVILALSNCNTLIGMGRDTKIGFQWCNDKIQNMEPGGGGGGGSTETYEEVPVY